MMHRNRTKLQVIGEICLESCFPHFLHTHSPFVAPFVHYSRFVTANKSMDHKSRNDDEIDESFICIALYVDAARYNYV